MSAKPLGSGAVIELEKNKFLLIGMNCSMRFMPKPDSTKKVDFLRLEEGCICDGKWIPGRVLNGDEKMSLNFSDMVKTLLVEVYEY